MSNFICPICERTFDKQFAMIGHKRMHSQLVIDKIKNTHKSKTSNQKVRVQKTQLFLDNKYTKWYFSIIEESAKQSPEGYFERHHIIPRCLNGSDDKSNIIKFSARKHFICHWLLTKMVPINTPEYYSLYKAFVLMSGQSENQQRYAIPSILFEQMKIEISRIKSISLIGEKNSRFGKIWVSNLDKKEAKMIIPDDLNKYLNTGWIKGYIVNWKNYDRNGQKLPLTRLINPLTNKTKMVYPYQIDDYISEGWMKPVKKTKSVKNKHPNKNKRMLHRKMTKIDDFLDNCVHNPIIYDLYLKGESTRKIQQKVPLSHVGISRRIKIIKRLQSI